IAFFINNFTKISLHTIAISSFVSALFFIKFAFDYNDFVLKISPNQIYIVSIDLLLIIAILIAGLVGTTRMYLKAHTPDQVYGGYLVGAFAHLIAYIIIF
ncbi:MAG TPA: phosphatase PAP2 family protein, partial [Saprospiraceae bacterium]|nr:phosphatase PAP2 family protein [Saprospiraceae bacterium]